MPLNRLDARQLAPLASLFGRLADPTRLRVLLALADGDGRSISELVAAAGVSRTIVNRHLGELARMQLVIATQGGSGRSFRLHPIVRSADGTLNLGRGARITGRPSRPGFTYRRG
jgi:DNA-binding transcriptional ArsR family regulator